MEAACSCGVFELSVEGALGPLLRCAVRPGSVVGEGLCTVVRIRGSDRDLVEVVGLLDRAGLLIESIRLVDAAHPRRTRNPEATWATTTATMTNGITASPSL